MDLQLLKTFQVVAATGSFGAAAGHLFVTQSAVSLRIHRLEEQLGRPLFERNKGGVVLTAAGREFRGFATMIQRNWEQARQRVSALAETPATLAVGAQASLWPRFGFGWLDRLREALPEVTIRADMARPGALADMILSGGLQAMLCYDPLNRPGLHNERLMDDHLVLVSPWEDATVQSLSGRYALIDWGPEFRRFHDEALPQLAESKLVLGMGTLAAWYLRNRAFAAFLPARYTRQPMAEGVIFPVKDAPTFAHTAWVVWREDMDRQMRDVAARTLSEAVARAEGETAEVLDQL